MGYSTIQSRPHAWALSFAFVSAALSFAAGNATGATFQNAPTNSFGDDPILNASVNPYPLIGVSTIAAPAGQCVWVNTGLNNFITANPTNGSGPTGQGWSYSWAGVATEAKVEGAINVGDYYPYVVASPAFTAANGSTGTAGTSGELGGALFNISYTPTAANGEPVLTGLRWIQALSGTLWGNATGGGSAILDTPFNGNGKAFARQSNLTPFYDNGGVGAPLGFAGTYGTNNGYFVDRPQVPEFDSYFTNAEYENNPIAAVQFQTVLATDTTSVDTNGITQNALTLYGGEWWGFTFSASDAPEPASCSLLAIGAGSLLLRRNKRQRS